MGGGHYSPIHQGDRLTQLNSHDSIVFHGDCLIQDMMGLMLGDELGWHVDSVGVEGRIEVQVQQRGGRG